MTWNGEPTGNLRLRGAYSYYDEERRLLAGDPRLSPNYLNRAAPTHIISLRSATDLTRDLAEILLGHPQWTSTRS